MIHTLIYSNLNYKFELFIICARYQKFIEISEILEYLNHFYYNIKDTNNLLIHIINNMHQVVCYVRIIKYIVIFNQQCGVLYLAEELY